MSYKLNNTWDNEIGGEFTRPYFLQLSEFLKKEYVEHTIYPPKGYVFCALKETPYDKVKVVILGQDPYHGCGQAHGLCFSVPEGCPPPPSLVNIFKEIQNAYGQASSPTHVFASKRSERGNPGKQIQGNIFESKPDEQNNRMDCRTTLAKTGNLDPTCGDLSGWAQQGVLLLNTALTVRGGQANSHQGKGWEQFTDEVIKSLNRRPTPIVFLLWGANAKSKQPLITNPRHLVLTAAHPSPLSAYNGFFGCNHFKKANEFLERFGEGIDWIKTRADN